MRMRSVHFSITPETQHSTRCRAGRQGKEGHACPGHVRSAHFPIMPE